MQQKRGVGFQGCRFVPYTFFGNTARWYQAGSKYWWKPRVWRLDSVPNLQPPFISHLGHLEGVPQPYLGDLRSPWLLTTYPNWEPILQVGFWFPMFHEVAALQAIFPAAAVGSRKGFWKGVRVYVLFIYIYILPGKLTCPLKINGWKMYFLLT